MARRAIFKGIISFDGIRVPVKLYSAVEPYEISFHMLHDKDNVRLRRQLVCGLEKAPVPDDEIVKGLEVGDNEYVLVEPEDLAELEPETDRNINVLGFTSPEAIDPRFYDRPYHLGPDGEEHKYAALAKALEKSGKAAVCHWSFRRRSYNGALWSAQGSLRIVTLRLAEEVAGVEELGLPEVGLSKKERDTAGYLIRELSGKFDPSKYKNEFRDRLRDLVKTKAEGGKIEIREVEKPEASKPDELIGLLEASLEDIRRKKGERVH